MFLSPSLFIFIYLFIFNKTAEKSGQMERSKKNARQKQNDFKVSCLQTYDEETLKRKQDTLKSQIPTSKQKQNRPLSYLSLGIQNLYSCDSQKFV